MSKTDRRSKGTGGKTGNQSKSSAKNSRISRWSSSDQKSKEGKSRRVTSNNKSGGNASDSKVKDLQTVPVVEISIDNESGTNINKNEVEIGLPKGVTVKKEKADRAKDIVEKAQKRIAEMKRINSLEGFKSRDELESESKKEHVAKEKKTDSETKATSNSTDGKQKQKSVDKEKETVVDKAVSKPQEKSVEIISVSGEPANITKEVTPVSDTAKTSKDQEPNAENVTVVEKSADFSEMNTSEPETVDKHVECDQEIQKKQDDTVKSGPAAERTESVEFSEPFSQLFEDLGNMEDEMELDEEEEEEKIDADPESQETTEIVVKKPFSNHSESVVESHFTAYFEKKKLDKDKAGVLGKYFSWFKIMPRPFFVLFQYNDATIE